MSRVLPKRRVELPGDVFDNEGYVTKTAERYWNQKVGGYVKRTVCAVVVDDSSRLLLVTDHLEPKGYYGLPGGSLGVGDPMLGKEGGPIKLGEAADVQVRNEVGFGIKEDFEQLPSYLGQRNRHSLSGNYVILGKAEDTAIDIGWHDRQNTGKPSGWPLELREAIWWNGKSPIGVSPATYDIVARLVKDGKLKRHRYFQDDNIG